MTLSCESESGRNDKWSDSDHVSIHLTSHTIWYMKMQRNSKILDMCKILTELIKQNCHLSRVKNLSLKMQHLHYLLEIHIELSNSRLNNIRMTFRRA